MTTEDPTPAPTAHGDTPGLLALLALGELSLHLRLTAALGESDDPRRALALATASAGHLERARRFAGLLGDDAGAMAAWQPCVDVLLGVPAADWVEGMAGANVAGGVLSDLARLVEFVPQVGVGAGAVEGAGDDLTAEVREVVDADPALVGRLSLFGRRVFGRVLRSGVQIESMLAEPERSRVHTYLEGAGDVFAERMAAMGLRG